MVAVGYALSSEEHDAPRLVDLARRAEAIGFSFAVISDHFHPWTSQQGESPFVWGVLGAIANATEHLPLGTGVTTPTMRTHPAIVAHAAATAATLAPGRFFLGVGSGEWLNEHVTGGAWPRGQVRLRMLREAIDVIRQLWSGREQSYDGSYYAVDQARLYSLPERPPPILMASAGKYSARIAGELGDGLIALGASPAVLDGFAEGGGEGKPRVAKLTVLYAESEQEARRRALEQWPNGGMGPLVSDLKRPADFEAAAALVDEDDVAQTTLCSPDPEEHARAIDGLGDAGFEYVYVHQLGREQEAFFQMYEREILPRYEQGPARLVDAAMAAGARR